MAVEVPQMKLDPYTSTVPLVQMPVQDMEAGSRPAAPLQGQFGKKGTGALEIGDALFKGILQGHQIKEQRKAAQAQATIAAADSATQGAYQQYQDALQRSGGKADDPNAQAAYKAYTDVFNQAKATKAKFVIPEKPAKGQKKDKKDGSGTGFGSIKDFFEANPHVVPQIALLTMQPKPPGASPETTEVTQKAALAASEAKREENLVGESEVSLAEAKRKQSAQKAFDEGAPMFEHLSADEIAALPPDAKKNYDAWQHSREIATGFKNSGKAILWTDGKGNYMSLQPGEVPPAGSGYRPYNNPTGGGGAGSSKLGTLPEVMAQYAKEHNIDPSNMPVAVQKYVKDWYAWKAATTASSSTSPAHFDASGNQVGGSTSTTRGTPEPRPPAGFAPVEGSAGTPAGGMTAPPSPPSRLTTTQSFQGKDIPGMVAPGNVDLANRPNIDNGDGTHSSVFSMSFGTDKGEVLVPGVGDGKTYPARKLTQAEALDQYKKTGQNLGTFKSAKDADAYAKTLHEDQAKYGNRASSPRNTPKSGGMTAPPRSGGVDPRGTWQQSQNTQKVETEKTTRYQAAQNKYDKTVAANAKTFADNPAGLAEANKKAFAELKAEQGGIEKWYTDQVHAVRGTVPSDKFKVTPAAGGKVKVEVEGHSITFPNQKAADDFVSEASGGH